MQRIVGDVHCRHTLQSQLTSAKWECVHRSKWSVTDLVEVGTVVIDVCVWIFIFLPGGTKLRGDEKAKCILYVTASLIKHRGLFLVLL